jgi:organic radical activating enzyme
MTVQSDASQIMTNEQLLRFDLIRHMPLHFNALVVEATSRCNAKCAMCYQSAGPKGSDVLGRADLTVQEIEKLLIEAPTIETLSPRFHLTGGEAFLNVEAVLHLVRIARDVGFLDLTTTTNAYWARSHQRAVDICRRARAAGMTSMEISWDHWHFPYIEPSAVSNCLLACAEAGIETNLRILTSRSHSIEEAISQLDLQAVEQASRITCGPVFPTGRAAETLSRDELYVQGTLEDNCHTYLNLTVNAQGNVFPCCAGLDQTQELIFGNVRQMSLAEIVEAMNRSALLRTVVFGGISALASILEQSGFDIGRDYNSICHMCWSIFSSPEKVRALKRRFEERQHSAVRRALRLLEAQCAAAAVEGEP